MKKFGPEMGGKLNRAMSERGNTKRLKKNLQGGEEAEDNLVRQTVFDLDGFEMGRRPVGPEKMVNREELDIVWYGQTLEPEDVEGGVRDEDGLW